MTAEPIEPGYNAVTIYFHGQPGSPGELDLFGTRPKGWIAIDRAENRGPDGPTHFDALASEVRLRSGGRPAKLVGFSIGAYAALEVAARLPHLDLSLDLVSAAAPLSTGDYLDRMVGKPIFALAAGYPRLFTMVGITQGIVARHFARKLCQSLFATARGGDAELFRDAAFRAAIESVLRSGLGRSSAGYRTEVAAFVQDWTPVLRRVPHPVKIWHGRCDNWSPPAMAETLATLLPRAEAANLLANCSHYSTLREYLRAQ